MAGIADLHIRNNVPVQRAVQGLPPYTPSQAQNFDNKKSLQAILGIASFIPGIGDGAGLVADANMYASQPQQRTWANAGISALGMLPFVPGAAAARSALDMAQAARMQRAAEQGFDIKQTYYHGTGVNYGNKGEKTGGEFESFDPSLSGKSSKTGAPESTFYFTNDPAVASGYTVKWKGDFSETYKESANVIPALLRKGKTMKVDAKGANWNDIFYKGEYVTTNDLAQLAKSKGYDSLQISKVKDHGAGGGKGVATTLVLFRPEDIRSVNAAFDPAQKRSSNLMAGVGAAAVGTAAVARSKDENKR